MLIQLKISDFAVHDFWGDTLIVSREALLMPLEVKCHTVPHLKALTRGIEPRGGHGKANNFRCKKISLKSTNFTS